VRNLIIPALIAILILSSCGNKENSNVCESCENFEEKYIQLEKDYKELKKEYTNLESAHKTLKSEYNDLESSIETEYVGKYSYELLEEKHAECEDKMYDLYQFLNEDIAVIKFGEKNTYHFFDCIYNTLHNEIYFIDEVKQLTSISEAKSKGYKVCHCDNPYYYDEETDDGDEYMLRSYVEDNYIHIDDVQNEYIHIDDIDDYIEDNYDY